jgi:alpha-L-fucosidase
MGGVAEDRMDWWREAKFGMFIHWGVYAVPAGLYDGEPVDGIGEWIMQHARIPVARYRRYAREFNPQKYDPEAWAQLAADAGMKYIVITAKHHDGFALYDSAVSEWDIVGASPYGKDLIAPLAEAARKRGLRFGLYYSQAQDWMNPGGAKGSAAEDLWDLAQGDRFDDYLQDIAVPQTREILSKYQPDILWWDTPFMMTPERARPFHEVVAQHPRLITNNRLGGGYAGDTETPEQYIPATGFPGRDWETCMTLNNTWGFKSTDHDWKPADSLIRNLVDILSKGGNYLLNVGPTAAGEIPPESVERLHAVGDWVKANSEAVYGVSASPCRLPSWGRISQKGDRLFLYVFDWPADGRLDLALRTAPVSCRLLGDPSQNFAVVDSGEGLVVSLTGPEPDEVCSVLVLDVQGQVEPIIPRVRQQGDGSLELTATDAELVGSVVHVEEIGGRANLGYWLDPADSVRWPCNLTRLGEFRVSAEIAGPSHSRFGFCLGESKIDVKVPATGDFDAFQMVELGTIMLASPGEATASVTPVPGEWNAINVRRIVLRPVE